MERQEEIRLMAYQIWEDEGRPEGRDLEHWLKAQATWQGRQRQDLSATPSGPPAHSAKGQRKRARSKTRLSRAQAT